MVSKPSIPTVVVALGVLLVVASMIPIGASSESVEYVHRVEPAENGTLAYGIEYEASDVQAYENLSERGQTVFDRARATSPYVVSNQSATPPDFEYATDHVTLGDGVYAIEYDGEVYSLQTQRDAPGFNIAATLFEFATTAARILGIVLILAGVLLAGWQQYRR